MTANIRPLENARRTLLSVIVHGRNDTHGHNLYKRVALSLNCIAQLLAQDDEIIFVDWNTPDELPTRPTNPNLAVRAITLT